MPKEGERQESPAEQGVVIPVRVNPGALAIQEPVKDVAKQAKLPSKRATRRAKKTAKRQQKQTAKTREKRQHAIAYARRVQAAKRQNKRPPCKYKPKDTGVPVPQPVRRTALAAVILVVLLVTAGVLYTYFVATGTSASEAQAANASATNTMPSPIIPSAPSPTAPESAAVEMLDSPVKPGGQTSVSIHTLANSRCTIAVTYNNVPTKAAGLTPKVADIYGDISWDWPVDPGAPVGTWPVTITCTHGKKSAVVIANLEVSPK